MKLQIRDVIADASIDVRERMDETTIREYMDIFERLPPVVVFDTPEGYLLSDGLHRLTAAERLGQSEIEAEIREGTRADALEFAAHANAAASLKLTPEERRVGIRRLISLHPEWDNQQIANLMACSAKVVQTTKDAIRVRKEAPTASQLSDSRVNEIGRATMEHWEPLAKAANERGWTTEEVRLARQNLVDPRLPDEHKRAILKGDTEPVTHIGDEPALLRQTVQRHLAKEAKKDYQSFVEGAIYNFVQLQRFPPREVVDGLEAGRLASLVRELPNYVDYLNEIIMIGRQRLEIWTEAGSGTD